MYAFKLEGGPAGTLQPLVEQPLVALTGGVGNRRLKTLPLTELPSLVIVYPAPHALHHGFRSELVLEHLKHFRTFTIAEAACRRSDVGRSLGNRRRLVGI